jgi:ubiquinone/menaquinone biosynthesis C-methylase UbiE
MTDNQPLLTPEELWRKYDAVETKLTAPVSERMLDLAGLRAGMRVLDLATGRGEPALRAARRVGPQGFVLGVELSGPVLQMAREKAILEDLSNLDLRIGNAEVLEDVPTAHFDAATSRWGLMYMDSPISALSSTRRALVADGVLVAALWGEPERVPYFTLPRRLLARYRQLPPIDREAPGTFRYADPARITRDFGEAGFSIEHVEEMEIPVMEAETAAELLGWVRDLGLSRLLNGLPEHDQQAWGDEMMMELERLRTGGVVRLGGVTRIVLARSTH